MKINSIKVARKSNEINTNSFEIVEPPFKRLLPQRLRAILQGTIAQNFLG